MRYRVVTVAREYGSGGAEIASILASSLGWKLVDEELLKEISRRAKVPVQDATSMDEQVDPWLYRITRPLFGSGGDGVSTIVPHEVFDADAEASLAREVIKEAYASGNCVIVGRGAQCVLRGRKDVFNVFVYASWSERLRRVQSRVPEGTDIERLIHTTDAKRIEYVRRHFGCNRLDPHLYDLMIKSRSSCALTARVILCAMETE